MISPALLHIKVPIKFNDEVQPLCLNTEEIETQSKATVTGWGWTSEDFNIGEKPDILQTIDVPIWDNDECQKSYRGMMKSNKISQNQLCAGGFDGGADCKIQLIVFHINLLTFYFKLAGLIPAVP